MNGTKIASTGNGFQSDNEERSASNNSDYDAGAFLSRTDTRRDHNGNTIRNFNKDWVNFDDNMNDEAFKDEPHDPFSNFEERSALDEIFASSGDIQPEKKRLTDTFKTVKTGLGNLKEKAKGKLKRRKSSNTLDTFGIGDVDPIRDRSNSNNKPNDNNKSSTSKDFDALNFGQGGGGKKRDSNNGYNKLKKTMNKPNKPKHNNVHKADANNMRAQSLFSDFDFSQDNNNNNNVQQQTQQQQQYVPSQKAQDAFGDLFGDFSNSDLMNNNDNNDDMGFMNMMPEKKSVRDVMQSAYKSTNKSHNKVKPKNKDLFGDLLSDLQ